MISLLESNLCYKNLKHELSEIFPEISKYVLSSIYTETNLVLLELGIKSQDHSGYLVIFK